MLFAIYLYMVGTFAYFWKTRRTYGLVERRALHGVAVCVPLLAVRAVYPPVWAISAPLFWSAVKGNSTAYLLMTMLPEMALDVVASVVICEIPPLFRQEKDLGSESERELV